jgi:hypothetical protein
MIYVQPINEIEREEFGNPSYIWTGKGLGQAPKSGSRCRRSRPLLRARPRRVRRPIPLRQFQRRLIRPAPRLPRSLLGSPDLHSYPKPKFINPGGPNVKPWTEEDKEWVEDVFPRAYGMLWDAVNVMDNIYAWGPSGWQSAWNKTPPARRWFGSWNKTRMNRVRRYVKRALRKLRTKQLKFIRLNDPIGGRASFGSRTIGLGDGFFRVGQGVDCPDPPPDLVSITRDILSAETLVHEVVHTIGLTRGGKREKYHMDAIDLARDAPNRATRNADNYSGFAAEVHANKIYRFKSDSWRKCWIHGFIRYG